LVQLNGLLAVFLVAFALSTSARLLLAGLNAAWQRRHGNVPEVFRGWVDEDTLARMQRYGATHSRLSVVTTAVDAAATLVVLLSGVLPWLVGRLQDLHLHFLGEGLLFFGILGLADSVLGLPFELYETFGIEKHYGFSTITWRLWLQDRLKGLLLTLLLGGLLLGVLLWLLHAAPSRWWLWVWLVFATVQLLLLWLYPLVIAPLFNTFTPVADETLRAAVMELAERVGVRTEGIYQVDAGIRSRHANAYFTGVGGTKRIVLYDTLLQVHPREEIVAILAHEIGHWRRRHVLKQLVVMEAAAFVLLFAAARLLHWPLLYATFGFSAAVPYAGLVLLAALAGPFAFFLAPVRAGLMRAFEREADDYARALLGDGKALGNGLRRLARENLANLHPHPVYAWFYYSHPPLGERIARLEA
jgi:STE24 endopeptidase